MNSNRSAPAWSYQTPDSPHGAPGVDYPPLQQHLPPAQYGYQWTNDKSGHSQYYPPYNPHQQLTYAYYPSYVYPASDTFPVYPQYDSISERALSPGPQPRSYKSTPPPQFLQPHQGWQPYPQYDHQHSDLASAIALARDCSATRLALQESPTISSARPSKSNSLTSLTSSHTLHPPSPIMANSPVQPAVTSFLAHSPLSTAGTVSPYLGPMLHGFNDGSGLDLFAGIDSLGGVSRNNSRRLSVADAIPTSTPYGRSLSPALLTGPGIGTSPQMLSDDEFDPQPYPTPGLEGLFDDLALIAGLQDSDDPRSIMGTAGSSDAGSVMSLNLQQPSIPNLVVSAPDTTTPPAVNERKSPTKRLHRRRAPSPSNESPDPTDFTIPSGATNSDLPSGGMFSCACGKSFKKLSSLRSHAKLHGRERSFVCDQCNKGFLRKHDLTRHTTTHLPHGAKPYTCPHPLCGVTFTRQDAMKRHWVRKCQYRSPPPQYDAGRRSQQRSVEPSYDGASAAAASDSSNGGTSNPGSRASSIIEQSQPYPNNADNNQRYEFTQYLATSPSPDSETRLVPYPLPHADSVRNLIGFAPSY
ncbi:Strongly-conserved Zn-finger binding protein (TFIIIA) [Geranomyces variabilis]|uniref:Strongly-conserved Zn-finger binding protein (TFIIIA) n=1 Tax=Geranomyces variabilis TaxID=109894 RepID=A0AAD5TEE3_9FUNG|nr:Strongly-conserved Zn-finger binding protein (TFIIIA) [Geranomyces variabilis]